MYPLHSEMASLMSVCEMTYVTLGDAHRKGGILKDVLKRRIIEISNNDGNAASGNGLV